MMTIDTFTLVKTDGRRETTMTTTDEHGKATVRKFRRVGLGPLGHLRFNTDGKLEYVMGKSNHDTAITLRRPRTVVATMMFATMALIPSMSNAQTHPSAEMLKGFHADVYSAAQMADEIASKADKRYKEDLGVLKQAEVDLRRAIAEETDAAKFADVHTRYILASAVVSVSGVDVIYANSEVASAFGAHIREGGAETFGRWLKAAMAHEATFDPTAGNNKELQDEAKAKFKKLSGK